MMVQDKDIHHHHCFQNSTKGSDKYQKKRKRDKHKDQKKKHKMSLSAYIMVIYPGKQKYMDNNNHKLMSKLSKITRQDKAKAS